MEKVVGLTTLNILRVTRAFLMNFCLVNSPRCNILNYVCRVLRLLQQVFTCEKAKDNINKRQKISVLKPILLPKYSKKTTLKVTSAGKLLYF